MRRIVAVFIAVMLALTALPFTAFADEERGNFCPTLCDTAQDMRELETAGALFTTVGPATRIAVGCPSYSNDFGALTVALYKWDTDYETTVKGEALNKQEFVDFKDNAMLGFTFEEPLAAGSYYLEVSDGYDESGSGVGVWSGMAWPGQAVFVNGVYSPALSLRMTVDYVTEPEGERYGALPEVETDGNKMGGDSPYPAPYYIIMNQDGNADAFTDSSGSKGIEGTVSEDGNLLLTVGSGVEDSQYPMDFAMTGIAGEVSCKDYPFMALRIKITSGYNAGNGEVFLMTTSQGGAKPGYSVAVPYDYGTDDWQTAIVNGNGCPGFVTNALENEDCWLGMRYDVINQVTQDALTVEVAWIAFFQSEEAALAFDGDFSALPTAEPTEAPTPTAEPTEAPTAAPTTAPTSAPTTAPAEEKGGCGSVMTGSIAVLAILAGGAMLLGKKRRNK